MRIKLAFCSLAMGSGCLVESNPAFVDGAGSSTTTDGSTSENTGSLPTDGPDADASTDDGGTQTSTSDASDDESSPGSDSSEGSDTTPSTELPPTIFSFGLDEGRGTSAASRGESAFAGTVAGGAWTPEGAHGGAMSFTADGGGYVDITPRDGLDAVASGTLTLWFRCDGCVDLPLSWYNIFDATTQQCNHTLGVGWRDNALAVWFGDCFTPELYVSIATSPDEWHHFAMVVDRSGNRFYLDGAEVDPDYRDGSSAMQAFFAASSGGPTAYRIGESITDDPSIPGSIDEVRLYEVALDPDQVFADMNTPR